MSGVHSGQRSLRCWVLRRWPRSDPQVQLSLGRRGGWEGNESAPKYQRHHSQCPDAMNGRAFGSRE